MRTETNHFLIGLFVVSGMSLLIASIVILGASSIGQTVELETYFVESVQGLDSGSPLRLGGVKVGSVSQVKLVRQVYPSQHDYALVRVSVEPDALGAGDEATLSREIASRVDRGLRVRIAAQGLTGTSYLELEYVENPERFPQLERDWVPETIYIPSVPSTTARVTGSIEDTLEQIRTADLPGLIETSKRSLDAIRKAIEDADVAGLSEGARTVMKSGTELLDATREDAKSMITEIRGLARSAQSVLTRIESAIDPEQIKHASESIAKIATDGSESLAEVKHVLEQMNTTMRRVNHLVAAQDRNLDASLTNLRALSENLTALTSVLQRYPSLLLFGEKPPPARRK